MLKLKKILIVPCFNEANRIAPYEYWKELDDSSISLVFVNDASTDSTLSIIDSFDLANKKIISLEMNVGKANAIREGFLSIDIVNYAESHNIIVGFVDSDRAFSTKDIKRMFDLEEIQNYDAIFASRVMLYGRSINRSRMRHVMGRGIMAFLSSSGFSLPYDSQAGLKIFKYSSQLMEALEENFDTRWFFELELLLRYKSLFGQNLRIWEEPLLYWKETRGSKLLTFSSFTIIQQIFSLFLKFAREARKP